MQISYDVKKIEPLLAYLTEKHSSFDTAHAAFRAKHDELYAAENAEDGYRFADVLFMKKHFSKDRKFTSSASLHPSYRGMADILAPMRFKDHAAFGHHFANNINHLVQKGRDAITRDIGALLVATYHEIDRINSYAESAYNMFTARPLFNPTTLEKIDFTIAELTTRKRLDVVSECTVLKREYTDTTRVRNSASEFLHTVRF